MKSLIKLALRNVFRFKRRTFITFTAVSIGLALLIISISLMNGVDRQSIDNIVNSETSHLKIFHKGYFEERDELPVDILIEEPDDIIQILRGRPEVKQAEKRILFPASLIKGMDELPCLGVGMEPEYDPDIFNLRQSLVEGRWLNRDDPAVVIGRNFASDIGVGVGDRVTLRLISAHRGEAFSWNALDMEIAGIFDTGNPNTDRGVVVMPLAQAQAGLGFTARVTEIVARLNVSDNTDPQIETVQKVLSKRFLSKNLPLEVYTWRELAGEFLMISKMKTRNSAVIIMIMLFIASMGVVNTLLMAVLERTREIGVLAALGMKRSEIVALFLFEGGIIGAIGSLMGCLIGGLASWYLEAHGWRLGGEGFQEITAAFYPLKDVFYADLSAEVLIMTFCFGTGISLLASFYPALKAARLDPVKALRHF